MTPPPASLGPLVLFALSAVSGTLQWQASLPTGCNVLGGLATAGGDTVVLLSGAGPGLDNALVALDARTGAVTEWSLGTEQQLAAIWLLVRPRQPTNARAAQRFITLGSSALLWELLYESQQLAE
jgi:hypothetical protein